MQLVRVTARLDHHVACSQVAVNIVFLVHVCQVLRNLEAQHSHGWMFKIAQSSDEILQGHGFVSQVLHKDLASLHIA